MRNITPRPGFTILELLVVLALLIILAAVTLPSFVGLKGNADQKAAADSLRARIADARGLAMQQGEAYRLAVHQDGTRLRVAPDRLEFGELPAADTATSSAKVIETRIEKATVAVVGDPELGPPPPDGAGWVTIATFRPEGICREDNVLVEVNESPFPPIRIHLQGVTGTSRVLRLDQNSNGGMP